MARLRLEGSSAGAVRAIQDLNKAISKTDQELGDATKSGARLEKQARRIAEQADPMKKYNRQVRELADHVKAGRVSMQQAQIVAGKYGDRLERIGRQGRRAFGPTMVNQIRGYVAGFASVSTAIGLVRSHLQELEAEQRQISSDQLDADKARSSLEKNIVGLRKEERDLVRQQAADLSRVLNIQQKYAESALGAAVSGAPDVATAISTARLALDVNREDLTAAGEFAGSLADVQKATRDPNAMRNLGFLLTTGGISRPQQLSMLARNLPPALVGAVGGEATAEEGAAMFGAFSQAVGDVTGEKTKTAIINTTARLEKFTDSMVKAGTVAPEAVDTFAERRALVMQDPQFRERFLSRLGGQAEFLEVNRQFFTPGSAVSEAFAGKIPQMGTAGAQIGRAQELLARLNTGTPAQARNINEIIMAGSSRFARDAGDIAVGAEQEDRIIRLTAKALSLSPAYARFREFGYGLDYTAQEAVSSIRRTEQEAALSFGIDTPQQQQALSELRSIRQGIEQMISTGNAPSGPQE